MSNVFFALRDFINKRQNVIFSAVNSLSSVIYLAIFCFLDADICIKSEKIQRKTFHNMSQRDTVFDVSVLNFKAIVQNDFLCRSSKYEVPANFLGGRESSVKHLEKHVGRFVGNFSSGSSSVAIVGCPLYNRR